MHANYITIWDIWDDVHGMHLKGLKPRDDMNDIWLLVQVNDFNIEGISLKNIEGIKWFYINKRLYKLIQKN